MTSITEITSITSITIITNITTITSITEMTNISKITSITEITKRAFHLHDQVGQTGKSFCVLMERPGPKLSSTFFSFVLYSSAVFDNGGRKRFFYVIWLLFR